MTKAAGARRAKIFIIAVFCAITVLSLGLRARFIERNSPTYDEPYHLFQGVFFEQKKYWQEIGSHPPFFQWTIGKLSPYLGVFKDADAFLDDGKSYRSFFQYRIDDFSGMKEDEAIQRARWVFSLFWVMLAASTAWSAYRFGLNAWSALTLYAFVSLEPIFLAHSALLKNDIPPVALSAMGTALCLSASPWAWALAALTFTAAWGMKFSAIFWALPLALGIWLKKIPARAAPAWALGAAGSILVTAWLGHPNFSYVPADPSFRLSYLDGILFAHTPLSYFLQASLCKLSLAVYAALGWIWYRRDSLPRPEAKIVVAALVASLIAPSFILPGIGLRLILPILLVIVFFIAARVDDMKPALLVIALLMVESSLNRDALLAYQNPLAGSEPRLADSNLDWGQGLHDLGEWRKSHSDVPLALALFGGGIPEMYGIEHYRSLASSPELWGGDPLRGGTFNGYVAVSRNFVYGYMVNEPSLTSFRAMNPVTCFQGALCLYDVRERHR